MWVGELPYQEVPRTTLQRCTGYMQIVQYTQSTDGMVETLMYDDGGVYRRTRLPESKEPAWSPWEQYLWVVPPAPPHEVPMQRTA
jgi:hypothetical protein